MRKHGALLNDDIFKCTWHSKGYYSYHSNFPHMNLSLHSNIFSKWKWIKSLYIFKIKICINTVNPWDAEKENKKRNSYMQNVDWWVNFLELEKKSIKNPQGEWLTHLINLEKNLGESCRFVITSLTHISRNCIVSVFYSV